MLIAHENWRATGIFDRLAERAIRTDDVLDAMEGDRVAPTPALYVHLIGACGRVGEREHPAAVLRVLLRRVLRLL